MKALENTVGKGENAGNQHFFPFPTVFSPLSGRETITLAMFNSTSANALYLVTSNILSFGKGLTAFNKSFWLPLGLLPFSMQSHILTRGP